MIAGLPGKSSPIFTHHIDYVNAAHYKRISPYESSDPHQIVVDYIASMTDNYFIDLHGYLFPNSSLQVQYKGYFDDDPPRYKNEETQNV